MALKVSGNNVDIGQALLSRIESTLSAAAAKNFDGADSGHVTVTRSGRASQTDRALLLRTAIVSAADVECGDAGHSSDWAAERLERRLRRNKHRFKRAKSQPLLPRQPVGAAARHLELAELPVVCFRNANHGGPKFVYRRRYGHVGWGDPALIEGGHA